MNYYQYPPCMPVYGGYPYQQPMTPSGQDFPYPVNQDMTEQSYIENILRLNLGKPVSIYMNFENSQWGSKIFKGILEAAGKDHIILSDPNNNTRYMLLTIYLNYVTFDEEINYYYPFANQK